MKRVRLSFLTASIAYLLLCSASSFAQGEPKVTLEQIKETAARWRASIVNLRVICESRALPHGKTPLLESSPPSDPNSLPQFAQQDWTWADHGLSLFDSKHFYWTNENNGVRTIDCYNGPEKFVYRADYKQTPNGDLFTAVNIFDVQGVGKPTSMKSRNALTGLYWSGSGDWLPDFLERKNPKLVGVETLFGVRCAIISLSYPSKSGDGLQFEYLWLDLEHDCLPRRYHKPVGPVIQVGIDFVVDEIQQLDSGLWFPKLARKQLQSDYENHLIIVTKVEINQKLDLSRFSIPKPQPETQFDDRRAGTIAKSQSPSNVGELQENSSKSPSAVPPGSNWIWVVGLVIAAFVFLGLGLYVRRRNSH